MHARSTKGLSMNRRENMPLLRSLEESRDIGSYRLGAPTELVSQVMVPMHARKETQLSMNRRQESSKSRAREKSQIPSSKSQKTPTPTKGPRGEVTKLQTASSPQPSPPVEERRNSASSLARR